jgi:hypothetical protein
VPDLGHARLEDAGEGAGQGPAHAIYHRDKAADVNGGSAEEEVKGQKGVDDQDAEQNQLADAEPTTSPK